MRKNILELIIQIVQNNFVKKHLHKNYIINLALVLIIITRHLKKIV